MRSGIAREVSPDGTRPGAKSHWRRIARAMVIGLSVCGQVSGADSPLPDALAVDIPSWSLTMQRVAKRPIGAACSGHSQCNTGLCVDLKCACAIDEDCGGSRRCTAAPDGAPVCSP